MPNTGRASNSDRGESSPGSGFPNDTRVPLEERIPPPSAFGCLPVAAPLTAFDS